MILARKRRSRRIERLELATGTHDVFGATFACGCGHDMTATVRRLMTYDGRFCDGVIASCPSGHYYEYWLAA